MATDCPSINLRANLPRRLSFAEGRFSVFQLMNLCHLQRGLRLPQSLGVGNILFIH